MRIILENVKTTKIKGFEQYTITNYGEVFSKTKRITPCDNGNGYLFVRLSKNGKRYNRYIHRLVYENFIGEICFEINHKDHNKHNNFVENLEDISHKNNMICAEKQYGKYYLSSMNQPRKGKIIQLDANNHIINCFDSVKMAAKWLLQNNAQNIKTNKERYVIDTLNKHLSGKRKTNFAYGYFWKEN